MLFSKLYGAPRHIYLNFHLNMPKFFHLKQHRIDLDFDLQAPMVQLKYYHNHIYLHPHYYRSHPELNLIFSKGVYLE